MTSACKGPPNVTEAFKTLKGQQADVDLRVNDAKTIVCGRDQKPANMVAISTGATFAPWDLMLAGTAIGTAQCISQAVEARCKHTCQDIAAMEECDLPTQHAWTILHSRSPCDAKMTLCSGSSLGISVMHISFLLSATLLTPPMVNGAFDQHH